jgi:hypothetical protein
VQGHPRPPGPRGRSPLRPPPQSCRPRRSTCPCPSPAPRCRRTAPLRACPLTTTPRRSGMTRNLKAITAPARLPVSERGATPIPQGARPESQGRRKAQRAPETAVCTRDAPSRCLTRTSGLSAFGRSARPRAAVNAEVPAPCGPRGLLFQPLPRWHPSCRYGYATVG